MTCRRILIVTVIVIATFTVIFLYVDTKFSVDRILPSFQDAVTQTSRKTTVDNPGKVVAARRPSLAADRRVCLPVLLRSSYLLGNLTEIALQRWQGMNETVKWERMANTYNELWKPFFEHLQPFEFISDDESKYFVDFIDPNAECNVITVGIGGTVDGEKELFGRYPQCRFLGVDPDANTNKHLVESIAQAKFVQAAVAAKTGRRTASVRQSEVSERSLPTTQACLEDGNYADVELQHTAFVDLLKAHNKRRLVDLLILDVEGAEYGILPLLIESAKELPTICQINMELHAPLEYYSYSLSEFYVRFASLLLDARYIPVHIEISGPEQFLRLFLLNMKDDVCIDKFLC